MIRNLSEALYRSSVRFKTTHYLEAIYISLLPILLGLLYRFSPFNNNDGFLDAWIYFGYAHNFQDLIDRYGLPYYSVRHGLIFPLIALVKIFGPIKGYLAFVYSMYLLAGIPLYLLFRKFFSVHAAVVAYAILVSSVWFARTVLWTHPDASAVPYLIAAIGLVFLKPKCRRLGNLAIGILIGLAVNSNVYALSIGGLIGLAYLLYYKDTLRTRLWQDISCMAAGFFLVFSGGMLAYYLCCGQINYFKSTLDMMTWSVEGSGQVYQSSLLELLKINYLYLLPFLFLSMGLMLNKTHSRFRLISFTALSYLGAVIVFVVWYEFFTKTAVLEYSYYFSFLLVPCIICMALVPVILAEAGNSKFHLLNLAMASFFLPPLVISYGFPTILDHFPNYLLGLGLVLSILLIMLSTRFKKIVPYAIVGFALSLQIALLSSVIRGVPVYARMHGMADQVGLSRYRLGLNFIETMPKFEGERRPIYFWYANTDGLANSLQSTYLWGYSRLMDSSKETLGLPNLEGVNLDLLSKRSSLVLFDRNSKIVDMGIEALRHHGIQFLVNKTHEICEMDICYTIALLDVSAGISKIERDWKQNQDRLLDVVLDWSTPGAGANIQRDNSIISVVTPPKAWNYGAVVSLVFSGAMPPQGGVVRILVSVKDANVGLGFTGSNHSNFIKRTEVFPEDEPQQIFFEFDNLSELHKLVISTWDQDKSAEVQILEFSVRVTPLI